MIPRLSLLTCAFLITCSLSDEGVAQQRPANAAERPGERPAGSYGAGQRPDAAEISRVSEPGVRVETEPRFVSERSVTGADGVETRISDVSRIVTLGGAITETVYALGYGDQVVGSDQSSLYPYSIFQKPRLNVFRQSTAEGILSLEPTLVVTTIGIRPTTVPDQLRQAGIPVLLLDDAYSAEQAADRIRTLAEALDQTDKAEEILSIMNQDIAAAREIQEKSGITPRVLFVYTRGASMVNVAGQETGADAVISLIGGENVVSGYEGYRPLTAEAAVTAAPDVILVPQHGVDMIGGMEMLIKQPGLSMTPAAKNGAVIAVDDALLLSFGPRLGQGILELTREILEKR